MIWIVFMSLVIIKCLNVRHTDAKTEQEKGQWKERDFSNVNKFYAKHELAMK